MLRDEWEFQYTAAKLADAAAQQLAFREGRVQVWEAKKAEVIAEIKANGLNVEESIADMLTNASYAKFSQTRSEREATVTIDMKMRRDLQECGEKIREHTDLRNQYKAWLQVLQAQDEQHVLKLHHDDWIFFFGK